MTLSAEMRLTPLAPIRPSLLQIAERCGLAPKLAADYPEASPAADRGTEIHAEIADALREKRRPKSSEARAAYDWVMHDVPAKMIIEEPIELRDPETDEVITAGTPDLILIHADGGLTVVDWKTGRPDNVAGPDDNLQLMAYGAAASLKYDVVPANACLVFLDGVVATSVTGQPYPSLWDVIERVRHAANRQPVATPGSHCAGCYQRQVCPSWRERAATALALLPRTPTDLTLTDEQAAELVLRVQAVKEAAELAEELAKSHVRNGGRIVANGKEWLPANVNGRKTADVKALEAAGLHEYIREGRPYERWGWKRA